MNRYCPNTPNHLEGPLLRMCCSGSMQSGSGPSSTCSCMHLRCSASCSASHGLTSTYGPGKFLTKGYVLITSTRTRTSSISVLVRVECTAYAELLRPQHLVPFVVSRTHVAKVITDSFLATTPPGTFNCPYLQAQQFTQRTCYCAHATHVLLPQQTTPPVALKTNPK